MDAGIRVDVDTLRDCEALPPVLELLKEHRAKATFFITTGCDRAAINAVNYLSNPVALMKQKPRKRYGLRNLCLSLFRPPRIEEAVDFEGITGGGHEVGLHGYEHARWIRRFEKMGSEELAGNIRAGLKAFEDAAGLRPRGFASPGFKANEKLLLALEDFGFQYSSDFMSSKPFRPVVEGRTLGTIQVPVNLDLEAVVSSMGEARFLRNPGRALEKDDLVTLYFHPSYACLKHGAVERALEVLGGSRFLTYREIADANTAHI